VRQLAEMMVGSELPSPETRTSTVRDVPVLTVRDVVAVLVAALWAGLVAVAALVGFLTIDVLPPGIVSFTPHLTALLVLSLASQRLRMPQADGLDYRRGEG
jgi:simple sugar transport system permease protein